MHLLPVFVCHVGELLIWKERIVQKKKKKKNYNNKCGRSFLRLIVCVENSYFLLPNLDSNSRKSELPTHTHNAVLFRSHLSIKDTVSMATSNGTMSGRSNRRPQESLYGCDRIWRELRGGIHEWHLLAIIY